MQPYEQSTAWPFQEAKKLIRHQKDCITFETGYGPSGLPHIGTFGEVVRTSMVRKAFSHLSSTPTRLICFSDDMDGLRKVPDNIPNPEKMLPFLNHPLTAVPDPFGEFESFGAQNNHRLRVFLDELGCDYTFMSSSQQYKQGLFDEALLGVLRQHQAIIHEIIPTLRAERQKTYSPFLPISPTTGRVLQVPMEEYLEKTVVFRDENGKLTELPVTGGHCKLQWKVDWAMRWKALDIDYEMAGKDLIDSVNLASKIVRILGGTPPEGLIYEHFLDEKGGKISKSKGNGTSVEEWLAYAPMESLTCFMYHAPRRAKRLYFDVIPKYVDDYLHYLESYDHQSFQERLNNPVWYVPNDIPVDMSIDRPNDPQIDTHLKVPPKNPLSQLSFSLLLNLASVCHGQDKKMLWGFITRYDASLVAGIHPLLDELVEMAIKYYQDKVAPYKCYRIPSALDCSALQALSQGLSDLESAQGESVNSKEIQSEAYSIGKRFFPEDLKAWFTCFYEVLLGQPSGPRVGSFIALYGLKETQKLIKERATLQLKS